MALPVDRVQVMKQESTALGGNDLDTVEWGQDPIDPQEDAIESAGLYLQDAGNKDETSLIWRDGDDLRVKDVNNPGSWTLSQLAATASATIFHASFDVVIQQAQDQVVGVVTGLPSAPVKVMGFAPYELSVIVQSGLHYRITVTSLNSDGFDYDVFLGEGEWWPGPGSISVRVPYTWSTS